MNDVSRYPCYTNNGWSYLEWTRTSSEVIGLHVCSVAKVFCRGFLSFAEITIGETYNYSQNTAAIYKTRRCPQPMFGNAVADASLRYNKS